MDPKPCADDQVKVKLSEFWKKFRLSKVEEREKVEAVLAQLPIPARNRALLRFRVDGKCSSAIIVQRFEKYVKGFPREAVRTDVFGPTGLVPIMQSVSPNGNSGTTETSNPFIDIISNFEANEMAKLKALKGSGCRVDLPVWCLRWTHGSIHGQMVFGSGARQDSSIYELVHEFLTQNKLPETITPLKVVFDNGKLYSTCNRRLAALKMFQALRQHEVVMAPCEFYHVHDAEISAKYVSAKTTTGKLGDGLGVLPHGQQEAWHMGKPLFRSKQEWCDGSSTRSNSSPPATSMQRERSRPKEGVMKERTKLGIPVASHHVPIPTSAGSMETKNVALDVQANRQDESPTVAPSETVGSFVDYSMLRPGMEINVEADGVLYSAKVLVVTQSKDPSSKAPVQVHFNGYSSHFDEWVGADRIRSKKLQRETARNMDPKSQLLDAAERMLIDEPRHRMLLSQFAYNLQQSSPEAKAILKAAQGLKRFCEASCGRLRVVGDRPGSEVVVLETGFSSVEASSGGKQKAKEELLTSSGTLASAHGTADSSFTDQGGTLVSEKASGMKDNFFPDVSKDESCSSASDDNGSEASSEADDDARFEYEYELASELETEFKQQVDPSCYEELTGLLVFGTFRSVSAADSQHREGRGEVFVEKGPTLSLGCRVFVVRDLHRNRAWDFDRCWARILFAQVNHSDLRGSMVGSKWDLRNAGVSFLYGRIVRAEEWGVPRQKFVVCVRSKTVRSRKFVLFRPINGKFPYIRVPWNSEEGLPSSSDLHTVEVINWQCKKLPVGRYVEMLGMHDRKSNCSIMSVVQISLNLCDWENHLFAAPAEPLPSFSQCTPGKPSLERRVVCKGGTCAISIQHEGVPANIAVSLSTHGTPSINVHVVDVNAYLDSPGFEGIEQLIRRRSVGMWFMDYTDRPLGVSLPLFPDDMQKELSFRTGAERLCITFKFPVNPQTHEIKLAAAEHEEALVKCDRVFTPVEAGALITNPVRHGKYGSFLSELFKYVCKFESRSVADGIPASIEHLKIDFAAADGSARSDTTGESAPLLAERLLAVCSYLVNQYAGHALTELDLWSKLFDQSTGSAAVMPIYVHGRPDPLVRNQIERLMVCRLASPRRLLVKDVIQALQRFVGSAGLSHKQKQCVQSSFSRRLRGALPYSCCMLVSAKHWSLTQDVARRKQETLLALGHDLFSHECAFQVTLPLQSYMSVLGLRALKCKSGWTPTQCHMKFTMEELAKTIARSNARNAAAWFALRIFRQISLMNQVAPAGWHVEDAVVGPVGPSYFNVLVPAFVKDVVEIRVPVSALRSSTCAVDYIPAQQILKVACACISTPPRHVDHSLRPWCVGGFSCTILRNFAQPVPHHACSSSVIVADIVLGPAKVRDHQVTLGFGHRMHPEVFSTWPDLKQWYLIDRDVSTYSQIWSSIRLCQIHAAAAASRAYTRRVCAMRLEWFGGGSQPSFVAGTKAKVKDGTVVFRSATSWKQTRTLKAGDLVEVTGSATHASGYKMVPIKPSGAVEERFLQLVTDPSSYRCMLLEWPAVATNHWIDKGDLAILRCATKLGNSVLYGLVAKVNPNQNWRKTELCKIPGCKSPKCTFAHCDKELQADQVVVEVQLSEISFAQRKAQEELIAKGVDGSFDIQFIGVPLAEKKSLEMVHNMARRVDTTCSSPIGAYLTVPRTPQQKRHGQEARPLATNAQVDRALKHPYFKVERGKELNDRQLVGLKRGLQRSFSVVQGPPGTGKTTFLMHLVVATLNLEADPSLHCNMKSQQQRPGKILVCTPSNQAGDDILQRLTRDTDIPHHYITRVYARSIEAASGSKYQRRGDANATNKSEVNFDIKTDLLELSLHYKAQNSSRVRPLSQCLLAQSRDPNAQAKYDKAYEEQEACILWGSRVVVTTCTSALLHTALSKGKPGRAWRTVAFSTIVIDEAAQASEPDVVLPALLAEKRVVVVGDHKQLGPVVAETNLCKAYVAALEKPFLERVLEHPERLPANTMLNLQYRMHPSIRSFPSKQFYDSALQDRVAPQSHPMPRGIWPREGEHRVWIDCRTPHAFGGDVNGTSSTTLGPNFDTTNTSLRNLGEVDIVVEVYQRLRKQKIDCGNIAVITPYKAQQQKVREKLQQRMGSAAKNTSIGTVHALQGSEREYIILSLVRSFLPDDTDNAQAIASEDHGNDETNSVARQICMNNIGILADPKLLNVSLTRAKYGLVIVGNSAVLSGGSKDFYALAEDLKRQGCMISSEEFRSLGRSARRN